MNRFDTDDKGAFRYGIFQISYLVAFILFLLGAVTDIDKPGIYFDAVNPDYMVVLLLNPDHADIKLWYLPGTLLFGLFPVVGQIYHGALTYFVGLPFYALWGTGVEGIRLTNMMFGLLVLASAGIFIRSFGVRPVILLLCLALLALDPGFLFSFRTQFYITLLPIAPLLISAACIKVCGRRATGRIALLSGLLAGIACYGYFIYLFLVPAVAVFAFICWGRLPEQRRLWWHWVAGFVVGISPYALAYSLMLVSLGGLHEFLQFIMNSLHSLGVQDSPLSLTQRLTYFAFLIRNTIRDVGPALVMVGKTVALEMPRAKTELLLIVPGIAIVTGLVRPSRVSGLLVLAGMVFGFFILTLAFGNRLWLHHAALMLPVLYAGLALSLERLASLIGPMLGPRWAGLILVLVLAPFLVANASDRQAVFYELERTGGAGLSSDAIDRFAQDSAADTHAVRMFFPDWGVFTSFAMLTRGTIPYDSDFTPTAAQAALCRGEDAEVATSASQPESRIDRWIAAVAWGQPLVTTYSQRDGKPVLRVVRWQAASRPESACR